ncbi:MAG: hypothetical protein PHW29_09485 [Flavobacterium sp.]|jgi:hypothetical protein|nr:hypothetical protein [uncultured Flavobacterium sp.]MDD2821480.1 hypothetical protein [Flavobacterium sp.]
MKKIYKQFLFSALSLTALLFVSCDKDDATGKSTLEVSQNLKLSVTTDFASPVTIIEGDNEYKFTVNIDKPQSVDVVVKVFQIAGTASGSDYAVESQITIPAYQLSATGTLTILKDKLRENVETLTLQVGDVTTSNASLTPITVSFNIQNYTEGSLVTDLSWSTSIKDVAGDLIKPTDAADFKLRITNLDFSDVESIDDSKTAFESFEMLSTMPDGDYLVVAEAVSFKNMGSQGNFDIDLSVTFNQAGIYNDETFTFTKAITTETKTACGFSGFYKLAQITKSGSTYTLSEIGASEKFPVTASSFNGNYKVTADAWSDYAVGAIVPVEYNAADGTSTFRINNVNHPYLVNAATSYLLVTINADATVSVVANENYNYGGGDITSVNGTGTVGFCGSSINLTLKFPAFTSKGYALTLVKN